MKDWLKISCLLCVFGYVREIRPSENYHAEFLLGEWRNITHDELNREVYPVETYTYLAMLIVVFLVTDYLRYKPLIVIIGVTGIIVWSMLLWTTSLLALQISEVFYGTCSAAEVAYYTYIYAKVDKKYYPLVTSYTRAAIFAGKMTGAILAQLLIFFKLMNYRQLNYINLGAQIIATIWALGLPNVNRSLYFHNKNNPNPTTVDVVKNQQTLPNEMKTTTDTNTSSAKTQTNVETTPAQTESAINLLWLHFKNAYTNIKVVQWSIWYAVVYCGYMQVYLYNQVLWKEIEPEPTVSWNGAVEAILTALAAICALLSGYLNVGRFDIRISLLFLAALSALEGGAILLMGWAPNIYVSYVGYVLFGGLFAFTVTVSSAEVARYLEEDSYGLVFGVNTFIALIMQTILTLVVVSDTGLALSVRGQYTTYACYFVFVGVVYFIAIVIEYCLMKKSESRINLTESN